MSLEANFISAVDVSRTSNQFCFDLVVMLNVAIAGCHGFKFLSGKAVPKNCYVLKWSILDDVLRLKHSYLLCPTSFSRVLK